MHEEEELFVCKSAIHKHPHDRRRRNTSSSMSAALYFKCKSSHCRGVCGRVTDVGQIGWVFRECTIGTIGSKNTYLRIVSTTTATASHASGMGGQHHLVVNSSGGLCVPSFDFVLAFFQHGSL